MNKRYLGDIQISKNKFLMTDFGILYYKDGKVFIGEI